jgi:hypothetical protein
MGENGTALSRQTERSRTQRSELEAKRLALLRELIPSARRIAILVNPSYPGGGHVIVAKISAEHARKRETPSVS